MMYRAKAFPQVPNGNLIPSSVHHHTMIQIRRVWASLIEVDDGSNSRTFQIEPMKTSSRRTANLETASADIVRDLDDNSRSFWASVDRVGYFGALYRTLSNYNNK